MKLTVNIDHIATVRQARGGNDPDPANAAAVCEKAGADGIVCHLREDRRHIQDRDVVRLRKTLRTKLDLEMAATEEIIGIALKVVPDLVTLVPEKRRELTTEGGLDVVGQRPRLRQAIERFHEKGILVSLFIDPAKSQVDASRDVGSDMIEIHTGEYAEARSASKRKALLKTIGAIADYGKVLGLGVNAGHGLDYVNVRPVALISSIDEMSIGYAIIARALEVGLEKAVREMRALIR
ncbi:MAG TPA: pyridoxine 5'-phosphate synthase [Bacteroidota bacterium]|nr:pyridoxine 5'-phosphate synthase [Bacteroidota bacterium]